MIRVSFHSVARASQGFASHVIEEGAVYGVADVLLRNGGFGPLALALGFLLVRRVSLRERAPVPPYMAEPCVSDDDSETNL